MTQYDFLHQNEQTYNLYRQIKDRTQQFWIEEFSFLGDMAAFRSQASWIGGISIRPIFQGIYKYLMKYQSWITEKTEDSEQTFEEDKKQESTGTQRPTDSKAATQQKKQIPKNKPGTSADPEKGQDQDFEQKEKSPTKSISPEYEERLFGSYIEIYCEEFDIELAQNDSSTTGRAQDIKVELNSKNAQKFECQNLGFAN